ncbi:MAG: hypothetical protein NXH90_04630 [Flavobacteriaceae bacterium]|nr:hypothetical protein [Flavobacteriaceae bacterium]
MKTFILNLKTILIVVLGVVFIGCSGEDGQDGTMGAQGEQGPIGPQGQQGEQGPTGGQGEPGEDGNANVIASPWFPEQFSNNPVSYDQFHIEDEAFTSEILNSGTVLVYGRDGVSTVPIPVVFSNQSYYFVLPDTLGEIIFIARSVDNSLITFGVLTDFRYVIIPANNTTTKNGNIINFNKMSYYEVMDHFGLSY